MQARTTPTSERTLTEARGRSTPVAVERRITVLLRYDDYSAISSVEVEREILRTLRRHGLRCTFAVVPATVERSQADRRPQREVHLDAAKAALMREAVADGVAEAALHGFSHQTRRGKILGYSEFAGAHRTAQERKIREGQAILEGLGLRIASFVPPWNSYDATTLRILKERGFAAISADFGGPVDAEGKLVSVPVTCTLDELPEAIECARGSADPRPIVGALFHEFDFREVRASAPLDLAEFERLMQWLTAQGDVQVSTVGDLAREGRAPRFEDLRLLRRMHRLSQFAPCTERRSRISWSVRSISRSMMCSMGLFVFAFYVLVLLGAALGTRGARRLLVQPESFALQLAALAAVAIVLACVAVLLRNADRRIKACVLLCILAGVAAGMLMA